MTRVTVSIVNYRTPLLVNECVASIKRHPPTLASIEIAVVENGSGDDSLAMIAAAHPDIRLVDAGANLGFAGGNNLVLRDCQSDFVMLLNSDALVEDGTFDRLIEVMLANPQAGAAGSRIVNASDGADQDYPAGFPSLRGMTLRALRGAEYPAAGHDAPIAMERLHGAGMMMRGTVMRRIGVLDDGFFMYDEDVDWCVRARAVGCTLWLVPASRVLHHGGASSGRAPSGRRPSVEASEGALRMRYELRRSRYRLYRKHRSAAELCALKAMTDAIMALHSLKAALTWITSPARRRHATALLRSNLRIVSLNPFSIDGPQHGT